MLPHFAICSSCYLIPFSSCLVTTSCLPQLPPLSDIPALLRVVVRIVLILNPSSDCTAPFQPQNLVLTGEFPDWEIKLCDLEISRVIAAGTEVREMLGTPDYVGKYDYIKLTTPVLPTSPSVSPDIFPTISKWFKRLPLPFAPSYR